MNPILRDISESVYDSGVHTGYLSGLFYVVLDLKKYVCSVTRGGTKSGYG